MSLLNTFYRINKSLTCNELQFSIYMELNVPISSI